MTDWKEAFKVYGDHAWGCAATSSGEDKQCSCGYRKLRQALEEEAREVRLSEESWALQGHYGGR